MNKLKREDHATKSAPDQQEPTSSTSKQKYDPLNMFREIYLDHDSKTITMLLPSGQESGKHCVDKNYINCTSHNCDWTIDNHNLASWKHARILLKMNELAQ